MALAGSCVSGMTASDATTALQDRGRDITTATLLRLSSIPTAIISKLLSSSEASIRSAMHPVSKVAVPQPTNGPFLTRCSEIPYGNHNRPPPNFSRHSIQLAGLEPSFVAGRVQYIGVPAMWTGGSRRCAGPQSVCSMSVAKSLSIEGVKPASDGWSL